VSRKTLEQIQSRDTTNPHLAHIDLHGKNGSELVEPAPIHGGDLILPSGGVSILECAKKAFDLFAKTHRYFVRGRLVTELGKDKHGNEMLIQVKPSGLRSRLEEYFNLKAWRCAQKADVSNGSASSTGEPVLKGANCPKDIAEALLDSNPAVDLTPGIRVMVKSPIITEVNGELKVLEHGYYSELGGVYVSNKLEIPTIPLLEAVWDILDLLYEFDFVTMSDLSRAVAAFISPALRFGQLLKCDFPIDFSEADFSQSGKSLRQKMICAIYGETAYVITKEDKGGVGSLSESISSGLIGALPFIAIENLRDKIDNQLLESAIKGMGVVNCRVPYKGEVQVTTDHVCWQLSSNKASPTADLANRSIITRIRKRPGHQFKTYEEGDIISHITAHQPHYLGCVFAVIRAWFDISKLAGRRLRTDDTRHDFREWSQTLDWFVQEVFTLPPLLDGHQEEQERVSDPTLMWLRDVAIHIKKAERLDEKFRPSEIADICDACAIDIPGCRIGLSPEQQHMVVGKNLRRLYKDTEVRQITGITVTHSTDREYHEKRQEWIPYNLYEFSEIGST
jgi:hypothetical protein